MMEGGMRGAPVGESDHMPPAGKKVGVEGGGWSSQGTGGQSCVILRQRAARK